MKLRLNLGCGSDILQGFVNVDERSDDKRVTRKSLEEFIPTLDSNSVEFVKAHHVLEHVDDLDSVMMELHRVCCDGAILDIVVPLGNTLWDVANPDHKRRFNHKTFLYYSTDFQTSDVGLFRGYNIISQHIEREPNEWFEGIEWIVANLHVRLSVVK